MTTSRVRTLLAVMVAATLVVAAAGGGASGATATIDEETTTTPYQSEIVSNTVVSNPLDNESVEKTVTTKVDTNDTKTVLKEENASYSAAENASTQWVDHNVSGNEDNWHNATFTHGDLVDVEHAPGENVTMLAVAYNNTSMVDADQTTGNVTWYLDFSNNTSTEVVSDQDVDDGDIATVTEDNRTILSFEISSDDNSEVSVEDRSVPNETMYVVAKNTSVADDMSSVATEFDSADKASSVFGLSAFGPNAYVKATDGDTTMFLPVYTESVPDDAPDAYAVLSEDIGGSTGVEIHGLDNHYDAGSNVDVTVYAGDGSPFTLGYLSQSLGGFGMTILGGVSGGFALIAPAGLRRRDGDALSTEE